mgnify:CR=1 FL=1
MFKFKNYDFKRYSISLLLVVTMLISIGLFLIKQVDPDMVKKQIYGLLGGLLIAVIISLIDYHFICQFYILLYLFNLVLLILVKLIGVEHLNAQRWLDLKFFELQPSELTKIIIILFYAKLFTGDPDTLDDLRERIGELLRSAILVKPVVELHEPGSLPVSEGKAKRVVDLRPAF